MIFKDHVILKQDSFFYNMTVSIIGFLYSPYLDPKKFLSPVKNQTSRKTDPLLNKKEDEVFRAPVSLAKSPGEVTWPYLIFGPDWMINV